MDLSAWRDREPTAEVLREATGAVMAAVTRQLEALRAESAPATAYDPGSGHTRGGDRRLA